MPEQPPKVEEADPPVVDHIEELARRLREAKHLDPQARTEVADLLRNLVEALDQPEPSTQDSKSWPRAPRTWSRP